MLEKLIQVTLSIVSTNGPVGVFSVVIIVWFIQKKYYGKI